MRSFPFGAGIVACGTAFGAGWIAATLSTQQPEAVRPMVSHVPAPSSSTEGAERYAQLENSGVPGLPPLGRHKRPGSSDKKPTVEDGDSATGLNPEIPILTQKDVVAAFHAAIEQYRKDCNQHELPASTGNKPVAIGGEPANVLNPERPVRTHADVAATVRAALEQDREERDRHERQLRDGPYGEFNYEVNRMSERVSGINENQRLQYMNILATHRQTETLLEQRLHAMEITQDEFENGLRWTRDNKNQLMRQVLDTQQFEDYQAYYDGRSSETGNSGRPLPGLCTDAYPR